MTVRGGTTCGRTDLIFFLLLPCFVGCDRRRFFCFCLFSHVAVLRSCSLVVVRARNALNADVAKVGG